MAKYLYPIFYSDKIPVNTLLLRHCSTSGVDYRLSATCTGTKSEPALFVGALEGRLSAGHAGAEVEVYDTVLCGPIDLNIV